MKKKYTKSWIIQKVVHKNFVESLLKRFKTSLLSMQCQSRIRVKFMSLMTEKREDYAPKSPHPKTSSRHQCHIS